MKRILKITDPLIIGSMAAMRRAAANAQRLAEATGTPLVVMEGGKIVEKYSSSKGRGEAKQKANPRNPT